MTGTKTLTEPNAFAAGQLAYRVQHQYEKNPYALSTKNAAQWNAGYRAAERKAQKAARAAQLDAINARKLPDWVAMEAAEK